MIHFLYCPFTGLGKYNGYRGDKWLKNRIRIFKGFTLPALLNQTKKEFILWISWRPEEKKNPIVKEFKQSLDGIRGLTTVFTYGGLCFIDDKYDTEVAKERLLTALEETLPELQSLVTDDWVYMTIQPSDDMYMSDAVEVIQKEAPEKRKAVGWKEGYIMNYATKEVAEYNPDTVPPFSTIIFPKEIFLDPEAHMVYTGPYRSHEYVNRHLTFKELPGRGFCVGTHGENISTTFKHPYAEREILGKEREAVWLDFGAWDADPIIVHRHVRLWGRLILNLLPKPIQGIIKNIYHLVRDYYVQVLKE